MADTSCTNEPVCPMCGHIERDAWEIDFDGIDGETTHACGSCGEDYHLSRTVIVHYSSAKIEAAKEPQP